MSDGIFWQRRAYSPKQERDKSFRGKFIIRGEATQLEELWPLIESTTKEGGLGYFSNFSDDSLVIMVFHYNAYNNREKNRIKKKINQIKQGFDVTIGYYNYDEDLYQRLDDQQVPTLAVAESQDDLDETQIISQSEQNSETDEESDIQSISSDEEVDQNITESSDEDSEEESESSSEESEEEEGSDQSESEGNFYLIPVWIPGSTKRKRDSNKRITRSESRRNPKLLKISDIDKRRRR